MIGLTVSRVYVFCFLEVNPLFTVAGTPIRAAANPNVVATMTPVQREVVYPSRCPCIHSFAEVEQPHSAVHAELFDLGSTSQKPVKVTVAN